MTDNAMYFAMLVLMGLIFMLIAMFSDNMVLGMTGGIMAFVDWLAVGGWWLAMQTTIPGLAWIFYGVAVVNLIITGYGTIKILRPKHDESIFEG